jgi:arsenate reductase
VLLTRTVLFLCVENAGRSLMAEAIFNADPPPGWRALSAGTEPARAAHPRTLLMLAELGLPPPDHPPRAVTPEMIEQADRRITMGCLDRASCPARLRDVPVEDWALPDPERLDDAGFRGVREELRQRIDRLRKELRANGPA